MEPVDQVTPMAPGAGQFFKAWIIFAVVSTGGGFLLGLVVSFLTFKWSVTRFLLNN